MITSARGLTMPAKPIVRLLLAQLLVAAVTIAALKLHANAATAGFAYLVAILGISVATDLVTALVSSVAAAICYNFFFLPPVRTFTIQDPANWVALASFFITAIVASRLVLRARTDAAAALARQREVEALYSLSLDLFTATNRVGALGEAATRALTNAGAAGGGLVLFGRGPYEQRVVAWSGPKEDELEDLIAGVGRHKSALEFPSVFPGRDAYLPLNTGGNVVGVLVARGTTAAIGALESAATLVALAVERERFLADAAHLQAVQEGDALKTSLLRAVSHDLATPLTAIALQIDRLRARVDGETLGVVNDIAEHTGRLRRRIENLLAMARLEARSVVPHAEPTPAADLFRSAREHLQLVAQNRRIDVRVAADCPEVYVDPSLALEIVANLLENAHQAAPPGSAIELSAFRHPLDPQRVRLEVADRGPGLRPESEPHHVSDTPHRGLGLEIARSLAAASGGQVTLANRSGGGAIARVDLPAAELPAVDEVPA